MDTEPKWRRYLRFWGADARADVDDELRFHMESRVAELIATGLTREQATREAQLRFGDVGDVTRTLHHLARERESTMHRTQWLEAIRQDLRFAARQLLRSPGFTTIAILTLALGIGANSAIFSVVYSVLLRPLPYAHADRLLDLRERNGAEDTQGMVVTTGNFGTWLERARSFDALGALSYGRYTLTGSGDPRALSALRVTAGYWNALYIPPALGRYFGPAEDAPGAPNVVVISHATWTSVFGGDSSIIGRAISLNGEPHTVVGVAASEYELTPSAPALITPMALTPADLAEHSDHELAVVGRVRQGVSTEAALAELTRIETELAREHPHGNFDGRILATAYRDKVLGPIRPLLLLLGASVALVLLIACGNVTNLLLARAAVRQREMAIRGALGAARSRIIAQLLVESVLLAAAGAVAGIAVAALGVRFLVSGDSLGVPRLQDASLNAPVLAFTAGLALLCGVVFGLVPALRASRTDLQSTLRASGNRGGGGVRERLRSALVVAEIAVALVLLTGAGLLVRSAMLLQQVPPGFSTDNIIVGGIALPQARYATDAAKAAAFAELVANAASVPGVEAAALVSRIPVGGRGYDCGVSVEGAASSATVDANVRSATPGFFSALGIPLLQGRTFAATDAVASPAVVTINASLAKRLFGGASAIGRRISNCVGGKDGAPFWREVVGVTGDLHARGLGEGVTDEVYFPNTQLVEGAMTLVVRGGVPVSGLVPSLRRVVAATDPQLALSSVRTMDEIMRNAMATPRFTTMLLLSLALTGLVLAAVGIYGVIAYLVTQREQEIGIRMALGARASSVVGMLVRQGLVLAVLGVAIGAMASVVATRSMASMLYGVTAHDPLTFGAVATLLVVVAVVASVVPARRATRLDPLAALRGASG
ncbi:MAG: permease [Gemmatimonadetes bacterium]|nr:permease [Gemmatimonadota bacterium]